MRRCCVIPTDVGVLAQRRWVTRKALGSSITTAPPSTQQQPAPLMMCVKTARSPQQSRGGFVELADGTSLPFLCQTQQTALPVFNAATTTTTTTTTHVVVAHGLAGIPTQDPRDKTHVNDISYDLWKDCLAIQEETARQLSTPPTPTTTTANKPKTSFSTVFYTARGHGLSRGPWQTNTTDTDISDDSDKDKTLALPFTWPHLAQDMAAVIDQTLVDNNHINNSNNSTCSNLVIFGQSMGAATALYYAMNRPHRIRGLILVRIPRIWNDRQGIVEDMVAVAKDYQNSNNNNNHTNTHLPTLGAAWSNLPFPDNPQWESLQHINILLLCHGKDATHPIESGRRLLQSVLPHATLHDSCRHEAEARQVWPGIMAEWLTSLP